MELFKDKIAIVTGAASGIGREISRELVQAGATVVLADLDGLKVKEAATALGDQTWDYQLDVSDTQAVQRLVDETVTKYGRLDYMFNNAGFAIGSEIRDMSNEQWSKIIAVNLGGAINGIMAAYPVMIKQGSGHIVNTASLAGLIASPVLVAYTTTKHAVVGLSLGLRAEARDLGVKVSAVCPGFINTNIFEAGIYNKTNAKDARSSISLPFINADVAARYLLKGVERNQPLIIFPASSRVFYWVWKLFPGLISLINRKSITDFRKVRTQ